MQNCPQGRSRLGRTARVWLLIVICAAATARAQEPPDASGGVEAIRAEIAVLRAEYEQRLVALEQKLDALESGSMPASAAETAPVAEASAALASEQEAAANAGGEAPPAEPPAEAPAPAGAPPQTSNYFNPAISLIGNFLATAGHQRGRGAAELRPARVGARPAGDRRPLRARRRLHRLRRGGRRGGGGLRHLHRAARRPARQGRTHARPPSARSIRCTCTRCRGPTQPLPIRNLLGGEEGWIGTGVSVGELLPLPGDTFSEATVGVFRGEREGLFEEEDRERPRLRPALPRLPRSDATRPTSTSASPGGAARTPPRSTRGTKARSSPAAPRASPASTPPALEAARDRPLHPSSAAREVFRSQREQPGGDAEDRSAGSSPATTSSPGAGRPGGRYEGSERCRRRLAARQRSGGRAHLLAQRVLAAARRAAPSPLRLLDRDPVDRQRAAPPTAVRDRRPRRPPFLRAAHLPTLTEVTPP